MTDFWEWMEARQVADLSGIDYTDWQGRDASASAKYDQGDENAWTSPVSQHIKEKEHLYRWAFLVSKYFPGGKFTWDGKPFMIGRDLQSFLDARSVFVRYNTTMAGREVELMLIKQRNGIYARVDFNWQDPSSINASGKDASAGTDAAATNMQKNSLAFMKYLRDYYIEPLHRMGLSVSVDSANDRREKMYGKMLHSVGYRPKELYPGMPMKGFYRPKRDDEQ